MIVAFIISHTFTRSTITFWQCFFNKCAISLVPFNVHAQSLLSNWRAQSVGVLAHTQLQRRDALFTTLFKWLQKKNCNICTCFSPSLFSSSSCLPSTHFTLRFYKALCHLMHYSTDLCPLLLAMSCLLYCRSARAMQSECVGSSLRSDCPWFLCTWRFTLSWNLRVYFLCLSFVLFFFIWK